jgi:hypothetical protein
MVDGRGGDAGGEEGFKRCLGCGQLVSGGNGGVVGQREREGQRVRVCVSKKKRCVCVRESAPRRRLFKSRRLVGVDADTDAAPSSEKPVVAPITLLSS